MNQKHRSPFGLVVLLGAAALGPAGLCTDGSGQHVPDNVPDRRRRRQSPDVERHADQERQMRGTFVR